MPPRTPLRDPGAYFRERGFELGPAAAAVGVAVASLVAALLGFAFLLSNRLRSAGQADAAATVWRVVGGELVALAVALVVGWVIVAAVLHVFARVALSHEGSFGQTLVVTGWGTAPTAVTSIVAFAFLAVALGDASVASPEAFADQFRSNLAASSAIRAVVGLLVAVWQTYLYGNGLAVAFDVDEGDAYLVGGLVALGGWLLSLV